MINHGLSTGALFLLIGMIYEQTHTREIKVYGGLWKITPIFGTIMLIASLSSMGLPGLNGFVGEFTILLGAWGAAQKAIGYWGGVWFAGISAIGVIMAAFTSFTCSRRCSSARKAKLSKKQRNTGTPSATSTGARSLPLFRY
jgi:NADH:ubiquinone oxidoreductase subunit 4 (subunit M)